MSDTITESKPAAPAMKAASTRPFSTNIALTLGARLIMLGAGLAASVIAARKLGREAFGFLAVLNVMVALAVQIGSAGLPSANTYFLSRDQNRLRQIAIMSLKFGLIAGTALTVGAVLLARFRPSIFGEIPLKLIMIAAIATPSTLLILLGQNVFLAIGDIDRMNVFDAANQVVLLLNAVFVLLLINGNLEALVIANTLGVAVIALAVVVMLWTIIRRLNHAAPEPNLFRQMLQYSFKFHISVVAGIVILRADLLLVNHFRGGDEAGPYAVASQIGNLLLLLPAIIATLLFPRVAAADDAKGHFTSRVTRYAALIMLLASLAAVAFSFALPIIYGQQYREATTLLLILLPGLYLLGIESVMVQHFTGTGLPALVPVFWIMTLLFNITANLIFIPMFGARAAAITSSLTYGLIFMLVAIYFRRKTGNKLTHALLIKWSEVSELPSLVRFGLFSR